jgi:transcriptional regulator with GAF, ATPase, and Fis domain
MFNDLTFVLKVACHYVLSLITGENGTGKELVAREIHSKSGRADEMNVFVDMRSTGNPLLRANLFGHVKGEFTDAREDREGKFDWRQPYAFMDEKGTYPFIHVNETA